MICTWCCSGLACKEIVGCNMNFGIDRVGIIIACTKQAANPMGFGPESFGNVSGPKHVKNQSKEFEPSCLVILLEFPSTLHT